MKRLFILIATAVLLCGCSDSRDNIKESEINKDLVTIGFSQVGAESDWRIAASESIQRAFTPENGFNLIFDNAQQKQENQIKAVREFIDQNVDYIVIDPITEIGWDTTLEEAKEAAIPVIIVDRRVDVKDDTLYTTWIGSDFEQEGEKACRWLKAFLDVRGIKGRINIVDIQGTIDSSAQIGRTRALEAAVKRYYNWNIIGRDTGEFTKAKGREVMERMLKNYGNSINVVYCENDNEAFGAIEAIENTGRHVGEDIENGEILLVSFDATRAGLTLTLNGNIAVNVECNPDYGPRLVEMINTLEKDGTLPRDQFIDEEIFSAVPEIRNINAGGTDCEVAILTQKLIDERNY